MPSPTVQSGTYVNSFETEKLANSSLPETFLGETGTPYRIFYKPDRAHSQLIFNQLGFELPFNTGNRVLENFTIGKGGFGAVYLAGKVNPQTQKVIDFVGVKITKGTGPIEAEVAIQKEVKELKHVMPSYDQQIIDEGRKTLFQVMPLAGLGSLAKIACLVQDQGDKDFQEKLLYVIAHDVLNGLKQLHARDVYHLDLKPENVVLNKQGESLIIDFGCAKKEERGLIEGRTADGDTQYFSPPRLLAFKGRGSGLIRASAVDLWSVGISLYEIASGFPYDDREAEEKASDSPAALKDFLHRDLYSNFAFPTNHPDSFGSFLLHLLAFDEYSAPSAEQALLHPWFQRMSETAQNWEEGTRIHLVEMTQSLRRKNRTCLGMRDLPHPHFQDYLSRPSIENPLIEKLLLPVGEQAAITVCEGIGGLGKTQLATFAVHHPAVSNQYETILWLRSADELSSITSQIHSYACEQGLVDETATSEEAVQEFHKHLSRQKKPWLLVVDNADEPTLIKPYLPTQGGHILVTSRSGDWDEVMPTPAFTEAEGETLVQRLLEKSSSQDKELYQEVEGLPLAISQACAYIRSEQLSVKDYLSLLRSSDSLLDQNSQLFGKELPKAVGVLWNISLKKLQDINPESLKLLEQLAYLSPDGIPQSLMDQLAPPDTQKPLIRLALVQKVGDKFFVHRLLQKVMRARQTTGEKENSLQVLFSHIRNLYAYENPTDDQFKINHQLLPHGETLLAAAKKVSLPALKPHLAQTLAWVGEEYRSRGQLQNSLPLLQEALEIAKECWGENHEEYALVLGFLGKCLLDLSRNDESISAHEKALQIRRKVLGSDHPDVASSLNDLGRTFNASEEADKALDCCREALRILEKQHDPNHLNLAFSYTIMGNAFTSKEKYKNAIEYHEKALKIRQEKLGSYHPDVGDSLNNLGNATYSQKRDKEALSFYEQALRIKEEKHGPNHPHIAISLSNLACVLKAQGKYEEAVNNHTKALKIRRSILGNDHPSILHSLLNLGDTYEAQGNYEEAILYFEEALKFCEDKLGDKHSTRAKILDHMGSAYRSQGKYEKAIDFHLEGLNLRKNNLGDHHPHVANSLDNLGNTFRSQGKYKEAILHHKQALQITRNHLGHDHPNADRSLLGLGLSYYLNKEYEEAIQYLQEGLGLISERLGEDHHDVAQVLHCLGSAFNSLQKYDRAIDFHKKGLKIEQEKWGDEHLKVTAALVELADVYLTQGKLEEALGYQEKVLKIRQGNLGIDHLKVADSFEWLGMISLFQRKYKVAIDFHKQALIIRREKLGISHLKVADVLIHLGTNLRYLQKYDVAILRYEEALQIKREKLGYDHLDVADVLNYIGNIYTLQNKYEKAKIFHQDAIQIIKKNLGTNHPEIAKSLVYLGDISNAQGKYEEALDYYQQAFEIQKAKLGLEDLFTVQAKKKLTEVQDTIEQLSKGTSSSFEKLQGYWEAQRKLN